MTAFPLPQSATTPTNPITNYHLPITPTPNPLDALDLSTLTHYLTASPSLDTTLTNLISNGHQVTEQNLLAFLNSPRCQTHLQTRQALTTFQATIFAQEESTHALNTLHEVSRNPSNPIAQRLAATHLLELANIHPTPKPPTVIEHVSRPSPPVTQSSPAASPPAPQSSPAASPAAPSLSHPPSPPPHSFHNPNPNPNPNHSPPASPLKNPNPNPPFLRLTLLLVLVICFLRPHIENTPMLNISNQPPASISQLFNAALAHHQANRLAEAERLYRQLLALAPNHPDALHLLGVLACQRDQNSAAVDLIEQAIALNPRHPAYRSNLGEALRRLNQIPRAESEFKQAIALDPKFQDAYTNWGRLLLNANRDQEALDLFQIAIKNLPTFALAHKHLGDALIRLKKIPQAIPHYQRAAELDPAAPETHFNLGLALASQGRNSEAAAAYDKVLALLPNDVPARLQLADVLTHLNHHAQSIAIYQSALALDPANADAWSGMAGTLRILDQVDDAIAAYEKSLALRPADVPSQGNLALCLRDHARLDESLSRLRGILEKHPDATAVRSAMIFTMYVHPEIPQSQIDHELAIYNQLHVAPHAAASLPHSNDRSPDRRLKIGYVSADFRGHPVGRFMEPLLTHHNRQNVEIFCYSSALSPDPLTALLQSKADHWRHVTVASDADLADQIRADQIDILVDLSMHSIGNRLPTFARKPAPVQITYLAYCAGTGVQTIDYRLTDPHVDPPAAQTAPPPAFEKPLRLPETYWCYAIPADAGPLTPLPALTSAGDRPGPITFGSFNHFTKINDAVLALWAQLLNSLPTARLLMHVPLGSRQQHVQNIFTAQGIAADRVTMFGRLREAAYFAQYAKIDIALDPFPFAGGTTTCDALWMGVPVITLAGDRSISRGGASILTNLGLTEWISQTREQYLQKAATFSADIAALADLRQSLRSRMQTSPLMNAPRFAAAIEAAYRTAWRAEAEKRI